MLLTVLYIIGITAEAMTLAQSLASGQKTSQDLIDDSFNKRTFTGQDMTHLPEWFLDDEKAHSKPHVPTTKAAAQAFLQRLAERQAETRSEGIDDSEKGLEKKK